MYSEINKAFIDIRNLSELLFESPDIVDVEGAVDIPIRIAVAALSSSSVLINAASHTVSTDHTRYGDYGSISSSCDDDAKRTALHHSSRDSGSPSSASVEFRGVYFHYPEQPPEKGLKDVSFRVAAGTTTAVVGHTGAGA